METAVEARPPETGEQPEGPEPRDLRAELVRAMQKCTPKQRKWLRSLAANKFQKWGTALKLNISTHTVHKWLRLSHVTAVIALQEEIADLDSDLTRQKILAAYEAIAFADIRTIFAADGKLLPPSQWPDEIAFAVLGVDTQERQLREKGEHFNEFELVRKIKLHDRKTALDFLATYKKIAGAKRIEVTGKDGEPLAAAGPPVIHFVERRDDDADQD